MSRSKKSAARKGKKPKPRARTAAKPKRRARTAAKPKRGARVTAKPKRRASKPARKPALKLVRKPAPRKPKPAPPAFPQAQGASPRQRLLFDLVRSHTSVTAACQGLLAASAARPMGEGKWSVRETVLHLVTRDRIRLREMEAALRGVTPSWRNLDSAAQDLVNARDLAALAQVSWDDAVRVLRSTRQQLIEAIESVPDEPAEVWSVEHPFGWMMQRLPDHDRHHADAIKRWRTESGA
ncbi:MAG: DinB family protein [Candidatus Eisenbacteria bacterium]|nr:DinB family protein [Candidatus Eisenbacteria bacterium]